jgi:hypothetical protein
MDDAGNARRVLGDDLGIRQVHLLRRWSAIGLRAESGRPPIALVGNYGLSPASIWMSLARTSSAGRWTSKSALSSGRSSK